jgi:hypothetical protein
VATLKTLCRYRNAGHPVHITVNAMLNRERVKKFMADDGGLLEGYLSRICSCGVDDFKFLPFVDRSRSEIFSSEREFDRFIEICSRSVPRRFRMFHHRLAAIRSGGHGLTSPAHRHCWQALDDRAYDSLGAYACTIRLREGAPPIYLHRDSDAEKKRKLARFIKQDRLDDPICKKHCFDLYRILNARVHHLLRSETGQES